MVTVLSFSTLMCSFDESVWTLSSGKEALRKYRQPRTVSLGRQSYVKPLISLNSFTILPPWSVTCFFALLRGRLSARLLP